MNIASKILVASLVVALAACGKSTQESVDKAAHDRAADVAKAQQNAQPAVDAANRDLAKAQQDGSAKVADAHADANREVNKAAVKQSKEQAKADYDVAIAAADGDQAIAIEKCKQQPADAKTACEQTANSVHDETVKSAMSKLELANKQAS
jgi:hypothetical protein